MWWNCITGRRMHFNPSMELVAFAKTDELQPGQSQEVKITFDVYDMADWYEEEAAYILMGGEYNLYMGIVWTEQKRIV